MSLENNVDMPKYELVFQLPQRANPFNTTSSLDRNNSGFNIYGTTGFAFFPEPRTQMGRTGLSALFAYGSDANNFFLTKPGANEIRKIDLKVFEHPNSDTCGLVAFLYDLPQNFMVDSNKAPTPEEDSDLSGFAIALESKNPAQRGPRSIWYSRNDADAFARRHFVSYEILPVSGRLVLLQARVPDSLNSRLD